MSELRTCPCNPLQPHDCERESEGVVVQAARAVVAEWLRWMRELPDDFQIDGPVMVAIHKLSTLIPKEDNE